MKERTPKIYFEPENKQSIQNIFSELLKES